MKASILTKLSHLSERHEEVGVLLGDPDILGQADKFRELSKEYARLEPIVQCFHAYETAVAARDDTQAMLDEADAELRMLVQEEMSTAKADIERYEHQLKILLLPTDPNDAHNVFIEVRAGTGGDEAAIFAGDLFRMYSRYAERMGWRLEILSEHEGDHGGYKEIVGRILGTDVYSRLKFESGAHRVQRVPTTESQGRVHTSACTVAILPEVEEVDSIDINTNDLRIDTFRASGAGGQHVNKTDSAIRITHIPTGFVVECQDERSQHKNRARAMSLLQSRLLDAKQEKQRQEQSETRRSLVGSGDRSERIRTYNYPQGRVTDHRVNLTLYKLPEIMEGDLGAVIDVLVSEHQADLLAGLGADD